MEDLHRLFVHVSNLWKFGRQVRSSFFIVLLGFTFHNINITLFRSMLVCLFRKPVEWFKLWKPRAACREAPRVKEISAISSLHRWHAPTCLNSPKFIAPKMPGISICKNMQNPIKEVQSSSIPHLALHFTAPFIARIVSTDILQG